eukprot:scaffold101139_cov37-Prasinocladus_malaysianus.AAC.1
MSWLGAPTAQFCWTSRSRASLISLAERPLGARLRTSSGRDCAPLSMRQRQTICGEGEAIPATQKVHTDEIILDPSRKQCFVSGKTKRHEKDWNGIRNKENVEK